MLVAIRIDAERGDQDQLIADRQAINLDDERVEIG